ncbi:efflux RND transporter permease subunit [Aureibacter tunicatorum]|uniref:Multidrug efflux pump subunit AcrB n=1 Tax=Aureibacter tunicatorum TaxID=866807 RepID=A0AAE4BSJ4_9BACT|nr:efflux RND transporter permease subunit [Aureibacter tunicatorum]MDR6241299.1 multidrug efflux pump subunit AcrB [Aureibacter tunicatorum]BDD03559.1 RND transporter [Aureibacter tunicatorum]
MKLIEGSLSKPISIMVGVIAIAIFSILTIRNMKIDIFPTFGSPTIYVAQPYGGLSPEQMESFVTNYYEYHFLYVTGVKKVESKSVQGNALIKIEFHEGTDMSQAAAEVVGYVNRSRAFMPPGTVPPFVTRFDAGSVPVGQLVFSSETRTLGEIADLALFKVRPMFSTLPGVSAPPPFGGSSKTVVVKVDPEKVRRYNFSPDEIVTTLAQSNIISPAGNIGVNNEMLITAQNTVVEDIEEFGNIPLTQGKGANVYLKDIANVSIGADITTGYALVNGARSVYIPVTKRADASTWEVVQNVKKALPDMQASVPEDINVSYEFDQSGYVINSLKSVIFEGFLGALLTGLMVLLFLGDKRSALIVVLTIPIAILSSVIGLNLIGQTINIMTLGGLALSVGMLVDEATVTIENIHRHQEMGKSKAEAVLAGCREIVKPKLLILFSILAVFAPALFMSGVPKGMFMPMSLAVGFSMIASFLLSMTFVPVLAIWLLKQFDPSKHESDKFERFKSKYLSLLKSLKRNSKSSIIAYFSVSLLILGVSAFIIGLDIFPKVDAGQTQVRLRLATGTRIERTEEVTKDLLQISKGIVGENNLDITSAFIGTQPSSFPVNLIHLWTSGPHESVIKINLSKKADYPIEEFKEELRKRFSLKYPEASISFEPGDLVDQVINLGATNPIEVAVMGKNLSESMKVAQQLKDKISKIPYYRDVQITTPLDYPGVKLEIDRVKAAKLGLTVEQISKSLVTATSSSRFTQPNYWREPNSGVAYQVQVEYPQHEMNKIEDIEMVPIANKNGKKIYFRDVASWKELQTPAEYDRLNQQRYITLTANTHDKDLGSAIKDLDNAIASIQNLPAGVKILKKGQADLLNLTLDELQLGLFIAIIVIFLMLSASFQSFKTAITSLSILPLVIAGSLVLLIATGHSLNIQSYMGMIMAVGVSVSNAVLYITNAEDLRKEGDETAYITAAANRIRPILMTGLAMMSGMLPMALAMGEGGDQVAPLGLAVIGGLAASMISILLILPLLYHAFCGKHPYSSESLNPEDSFSKYARSAEHKNLKN